MRSAARFQISQGLLGYSGLFSRGDLVQIPGKTKCLNLLSEQALEF